MTKRRFVLARKQSAVDMCFCGRADINHVPYSIEARVGKWTPEHHEIVVVSKHERLGIEFTSKIPYDNDSRSFKGCLFLGSASVFAEISVALDRKTLTESAGKADAYLVMIVNE